MDGPIVVTGATGNVGRALVAALRREGRAVRAAVPDADAARALLGEAVECVRFRFEDEATFGPAFDGAAGVFLMRPPHLSRPKREMAAAVRYLAAHGRPHVVVLSVMGAGGNPLLPHHAMERLVRSAGLPFTFLRPSFFMQNLSTTYLADIRDRGVIEVPAGDGRTSFIDVRDVAEAAARVLGRPAHFGQAYTLTGAEALSYADAARLFTAELGRPVRYTRPSPREYRRLLAQRGTPRDFARVLSSIYFVARHGLAARVTPDTARLLGRDPIRLQAFIRDHRELWLAGPGGAAAA